ncbi:MAG: hypothetical protein C0483_20885 [Pirellula sp.]|nr:hypothetical protein [Pirellula sp.]
MHIRIPNTAEFRAKSAACDAPILRVGSAGGAAQFYNRAGSEPRREIAIVKQRRHLGSPRCVGCGTPAARAARTLHCSQHIGRRHVGC